MESPQSDKQNNIRDTSIAQSAVVGSESTTRFGIFLFLGTPLVTIYIEVFRYIFLPVAAAASIVNAVLCWRIAALQKYEAHAVAKATLEAIAATGTTIAVIGLLVATSLFAVATPAITAAMLGAKTLFQAISAIVFLVKSHYNDDPEQKKELRNKARDAAIFAVAGALGTAAIITVMIFAKPALAVLGIVSGILGTIAAVFKCITIANHFKAKNAAESAKPCSTEEKSDMTASMIKTLRASAGNQPAEASDNKPVPAVTPSLQTTNDVDITQSADLPAFAPDFRPGLA